MEKTIPTKLQLLIIINARRGQSYKNKSNKGFISGTELLIKS